MPPASSREVERADIVYDVLVLGAGVAGLNAAALLATSGRSVAVIEARERVGGRILTRHVDASAVSESNARGGATVPVELGAEFIHGLPEETWRLVREARLETYELDGESLRFDGMRLQCAPEQGGVWKVIEDMTQWLAARPGTDATFAEYLQQTALGSDARRAAIRYVEGFNAADHRIIGVAALARQQAAENGIAGDRLFHVRAGYDSLPRHLREKTEAAGGKLFLRHPVSAIRWSPGAVTLTGSDAHGVEFAFRGRRAVITLPLGVLHAGSVRFEPRPADRLVTAALMAMGTVIRVPLLFRSRFWRDGSSAARFPELADELQRLSFLFPDEGATWWTAHPSEAPLLTAWVGGPRTALLAGDPAAAPGGGTAIEASLQTLAAMFGTSSAQIKEQLAGCYFHDWTADPFARGAYSYMPAGALQASHRLTEPVSNTLYFAGEHANITGHWGTVHGALHSGAKAAEAISTAGS